MKIERAFELVLDMAEDCAKDCAHDLAFVENADPGRLDEMFEAIKTVKSFIEG